MKKLLALVLMLAVLLCSVSALADTFKVAVVYENTIDDKGWCQAMDTGIKNAISMGYDISYSPIESTAPADAQRVIDALVGEYDLIIVHGTQFMNALTPIAEENPDQVFAMGTSDSVLGDNIFTYMPQSEEPGYLNGIVAAMMSQNGNIGIVGPKDAGDAYRYVRGFIMGVRSVLGNEVNPAISFTGNFGDTAGASLIADNFINQGCDMLTGAAQQAVGALSKVAAQNGNVRWVAQTLAQMTDFPEYTLCAADYEYSAVVIEILKAMQNGTNGGVCIPMNYFNNGFIFENGANLPEDVKAAVATALEGLRAAPETVDFTSVEAYW